MTDKVVEDKEGGITLILKGIPPEKLEEIEEALVELMNKHNISGTFWSQVVTVKRKRKHRRISKGPGKQPGIEGYISETH